jgi:hypothetical protein
LTVFTVLTVAKHTATIKHRPATLPCWWNNTIRNQLIHWCFPVNVHFILNSTCSCQEKIITDPLLLNKTNKLEEL